VSAEEDRELLLEHARHEAQEIVAKAKKDSEALIERRARMAEDKIAAEERSAIEQVRATAADAAAKAAAKIIAERHDASTDAKLVDQAIKEIGR
jgi:F-type H+-transporting ATPase subunit b